MIRTWVIWKDTRLVHILLVVFALGQWIVLALDVANLHPTQIPGGCRIYITHQAVNAAVLVYSVCYDFIVLVLSIVALSRQRSKSPLIQRLRAQGFVYFVVAVVTYIPPTVFAFMDVNCMIHSLLELAVIQICTTSCAGYDWPYCNDCQYDCLMQSCEVTSRSSHTRLKLSEESVENEVPLTSQIPVQTTIPTTVAC
ncbi:hypothetical protein JVT61DRAFT_6374 [Boletus reticuloceps]|uniref:G-protein coupled receptors family 3 profile domain-containing protein n=1 Tax=Boletus reticuloceps TaxID=495285 RepID=A0A8I3A8Q0_9AGAM|nr:hypothetical protein JVT61DRAFT_6374 [Boletus reticuloceps]